MVMLPNWKDPADLGGPINTREQLGCWLFDIRLLGEFNLLLAEGDLAIGLGPGSTGIGDFDLRPSGILTADNGQIDQVVAPETGSYWLMSLSEHPQWINALALWTGYTIALRNSFR